MIIHYAPYGPNQDGKYNCGVPNVAGVGYTGSPKSVTCEECKRLSPGLWPQAVRDVWPDAETERLILEAAEQTIRLTGRVGHKMDVQQLLVRVRELEARAALAGKVADELHKAINGGCTWKFGYDLVRAENVLEEFREVVEGTR